MLYGFVVASFLILNLDDGSQSQMIPFATIADCQIAEEYYKRLWRIKHIHCVETGARGPGR